MERGGCTTELDYTEQTSWMLFLKYLDDLEKERELEAQLQGKPFLIPTRTEDHALAQSRKPMDMTRTGSKTPE